ncbi:mannose-ethanolamine phosphotransferase GPI13 [Aspergillus clavatus NRRL 1]|uniref:Phosphoethanolamine N-methyltransferase, putative n=1 Tax=Aspergillus clavatus (strain ATCC 1007 / CBS 513.65 / DSM 816 / NCTC 3887 / NRRL 1 / QM 1276 / 107) TaxID=344612 RepID=A1CMB1_ASPCL|nr:phosphoethanolamine N-methyltransferase, putative [Aspergillus clavatus NRRL 1]EAW08698.1 phosphoethanolamine N-methyltransferase, putative [Aspergillus clavatus NRRL 1]
MASATGREAGPSGLRPTAASPGTLSPHSTSDPRGAQSPKMSLPSRPGKGTKTPPIQDKIYERQFTLMHSGILGVLGWILFLHVAGIFFFTKGFLLTRMVLENKSTCDVLPFDDSSVSSARKGNKGCWHDKSFDKAIVIIIDALRYDFTVPFATGSESETAHLFHDNIPVLYETAVKTPEKAFLLPFIADPPTTTLQRLKGLTTGTLPTFVDAGSNFAGTAIDEDNLVAQLHAAGKTLVHLGDDTWQALFPGYFDANLTKPFDSFNVWDLHTVDNGVTEHLFPLLHPANATKWDVIFGHYLGVDHAGHRYGPDHPAMAAKLREMDQVIRNLIATLDDKTLLVVMGDHGMDSKGDHGGESDDEVEAALWMYSKKGIFGRTSPETANPPATARERFVPQIDLVPTLSLLLGMAIPFNNLGSPIEEAFIGVGGKNWKNLATVNRLTSAQIKRYQQAYASSHGADDRQALESGALWETADGAWQKVAKAGRSNMAALRSASDLHRQYQRHILQVCRSLWAKFDVTSMLQGIGILFAAIILLVFYARGIRTARPELTRPLLSSVGVGSALGVVAGVGLSYAHIVTSRAVESSVFLAAVGSIIGGFWAIFGHPGRLSLPLPDTLWGWLALVFTISQSIGFASNSYTIWEDEILLFFLTTFGVAAGASSMRQKSTADRVLGVYHSILFVILGRIASFARLCREEQMPFCRSTYYASATSSTSAPWQLIIPCLVTLILPAVVRSFYAGSKSYEGAATLWIGFAFRLGLVITSMFWMLEAADDGEWGFLSKETLKTLRVFLAQLVLAIAFAAGTAAFIYTKPCVSISVSQGGNETEGKDPVQQPGRRTVTILGFGNVYGTRAFFLVINFCLAIILMQKPMGQGAIGLLLWQILSLLEILDTNALVTGNSAIGPVVLGLLGSFYFFKTGHQATLSSVQWETAFIPLSSVQYPWSPLLVILNTFGAQILTAIAVPLTVLWKRPLQLHESATAAGKSGSPITRILSDVAQAACTYILYFATINLATTMWAGHLRRHLMLFRIFSPRFMMGAIVLGVVDIVMILFSVFGVRFSVLSVAEIFGW